MEKSASLWRMMKEDCDEALGREEKGCGIVVVLMAETKNSLDGKREDLNN